MVRALACALLSSALFAATAGAAPAQDDLPAGVVRWPVGTATAAATRPAVLIAPTWVAPPTGDGPALSEGERRAFFRTFRREVARGFSARGYAVRDPATVERALTLAGSGAACVTPACAGRAAVEAAATRIVLSSLAPEAGHCAARAEVRSASAPQDTARRLDDYAAPCHAEGLLTLARRLGRAAARGRAIGPRADLDLTPRTVPTLEIPDIADVVVTRVATSTRASRSLPRGVALDVYEARHMVVFESERYVHIAQAGRLLTECEAWQQAWQAEHDPLDAADPPPGPIPEALERHCRGNAWEWAWLGVPTGAIIAWGSWGDLRQGDLSGLTGFTLGVVTAAVTAGLALTFDEDAVDPAAPEYRASRAELEALVARANAALRRRLELSDQDVLVAGMRR